MEYKEKLVDYHDFVLSRYCLLLFKIKSILRSKNDSKGF